MQAGQSDWKHVTKYTIADGQTEGIWYDAGGTFIGDNKTTLEAADDAATRKLGSPWRMPTLVEIRELLDANNCTWTWTTQDGKNGYEVKSKTNGNSIFLPAAGDRGGSVLYGAGRAGYYWSGSLSTAYSYGARDLGFGRYFVNAPGGNLVDDHVYVIRGLRIPCLDIVNYAPDRATGFGAYWHTGGDTMDNIDRATLRAVGQTVLYVIKN